MKANSSNKGNLILCVGSTGVGKTTLVYSLLDKINKEHKDFLLFHSTYTTRSMRNGERNGIDYFFVSEEEFFKKQKEGFFLEFTQIDNIWYGTSKKAIDLLNLGYNLIMIVNASGVEFWKKIYFNVFSIFISVSSIDSLNERIQLRDNNDVISFNRLENLKQNNPSCGSFIVYDYYVINDSKEIAESELYNFILTIIKNKKNVDS